MADSVLTLADVRKSFGANTVLSGISLDVAPGEVIGLIGPSGCGKSTLLRCVNRLETPTGGEIRFRGEVCGDDSDSLNALRRRVGMVFQRFHLFPHLTARQNVALAPQKVLGLARPDALARADSLLKRVRLDAHADRFPSQLSGGQQQRVAIARALALQPDVLLFDEPTSALDPELVGEVLSVLRDLAREGRTMLIATHEMGFCRDVAHRVCFLDGGRIVEEGPPARLFDSPTEARTREFLARVRER
jgi:polar amino acid transport system ATP-binding protein